MRIIVDGFPEQAPEGLTLDRLIEDRGEDTVHLIAEVNHRYVHRRDYPATVLTEGDQIEIIHPAFGG